jgi:hypothetical protein
MVFHWNRSYMCIHGISLEWRLNVHVIPMESLVRSCDSHGISCTFMLFPWNLLYVHVIPMESLVRSCDSHGISCTFMLFPWNLLYVHVIPMESLVRSCYSHGISCTSMLFHWDRLGLNVIGIPLELLCSSLSHWIVESYWINIPLRVTECTFHRNGESVDGHLT